MVEVIAHRGLRREFPENTCEAITAALSLPGIFAVEFDVELSDIPLVLHQESMVPNESFTVLEPAVRDYLARDWVSQYPATQIQTLDAGSWHCPSFASLRVPTLAEVKALHWSGKRAYAELKDPTYWGTKELDRPKRVVDAAGPVLAAWPGPLSIISFNPQILNEMSQSYPEISRVLGLWIDWRGRLAEAIETALLCEVETISLADVMVLESPEWVSEIQAAGLRVHVYPISPTIDEPDYQTYNALMRQPVWLQLLSLGVDGIITDFARELLKMIEDHDLSDLDKFRQ